jgi:putative DNA primase/helicase
LIPFEVKIPEAERDKNIGEKLKAVYPGILRWAVEGCLEWQREGLNEPPEVIAATKSYQEEMDVFGRFLAEETVELLEAKVQANALYNRYVEWCKENGENPMTGTTFGKRMRELGHEKEHQRTGTFYKGLGLINNPEERVPF